MQGTTTETESSATTTGDRKPSVAEHTSDCAIFNAPAYQAGPCSCGVELLPGEGDTKTIIRTRVRIACDECGEPATQRHTYLLPNARSNPASSAYRHDDCSWCSDHEAFTCSICQKPKPDGYRWCSTFSIENGKLQFAHMFLYWREREVPNATISAPGSPVARDQSNGQSLSKEA